MWKEKEKGNWPIRLVLNSKASNVLDFHTRHYSGRGLMKKMTGKELVETMGCGAEALQKTFDTYNKIAEGKEKDPWGKKYFHNFPFNLDDTFHVAEMEPVLHFTMGGIEINDQAQCLNKETGKPFEGLFVCGELAGGVHGANRLGGSSLLGCVVYGRVAGESASKYLFQEVLNGGISTAAQRLGQISLHIDPNNPGKISVEWQNGGENGERDIHDAPKRHQQQSVAPVMSKSDSDDPGKVTKPNDPKAFEVPEQEYTLEEVAKHNKKDDLWVAVKGVVMNITDWVNEHPGGPQALYSHMVSLFRNISTSIMTNMNIRDVMRRRSSRCFTMMKLSPNTPHSRSLDVSRTRKSLCSSECGLGTVRDKASSTGIDLTRMSITNSSSSQFIVCLLYS